jgi:hypothetical protein
LVILRTVLSYPFTFLPLRHDLAPEVLALRHLLMVLKRQMGTLLTFTDEDGHARHFT